MNRILLTALIVGSIGAAGTTLTGTARAAGDAAAGQAKATSCAMCHGPDGKGTKVGPKLVGLQPAAFVQALNDYKSGKRDNAMMKAQTAQLSPTDMANLAAYYATMK
jgi:cytochrome c553